MATDSLKIQAIIRSKRRSIALVITKEGELIIRAPKRASQQFIDALVKKNEFWIRKKKQEAASRPKLSESLINGYKSKANAVIQERSARLSALTGYNPASVKTSGARSRWGSCSSKGHVKISWRLVMAPVDVMDYVIVHELVHLEEKNHAKRFWEKVARFVPDYKERKSWLRANQTLLESV